MPGGMLSLGWDNADDVAGVGGRGVSDEGSETLRRFGGGVASADDPGVFTAVVALPL